MRAASVRLPGIGAALLTAVGTLVLLAPPAAAADGPPAPAPPPATVEAPAPYVGQAVCDPAPKRGTETFAEAVLRHYGSGSDLGVGRDCAAGGPSEHKEGRAWDWGLRADVPAQHAVAEEFLAWLAAPGPAGERAYNARRLGVMYVIWNGEIWSPVRAGEGRLPYGGPNPHTDHLHVSLSWAGALGLTSFWTGVPADVGQGPCTPEPSTGGLPPCPAGQEQPAPSEDAATLPQEESAVPADGDAEARALAELAALRAQSLARAALDGRWVAQLASKDVGITDPLQTAQNGTHVFHAVDVLAESRAALATVTDPSAVLVLQGTDFGRRSTADDGDPYWITVVDAGFTGRGAVEAWCAATYPQLHGAELTNACVPRRLTPPHG